MNKNRRSTDCDINSAVLIVDDNERNRFAFKEILEELECKLLEADSGDTALMLAINEPLALILLDVQMPDMDGFEVAELLKSNKYTSNIPIVFVTAISKEQKHVRRGHELGAADYIVKPVDPVILQYKVSHYIDLYHQKHTIESKLTSLSESQEDLSQQNRELELLAKHDALTGLYNRLRFDEALTDTISVAKLNHFSFTLMYIDLDDFKQVNDQHGHDAGDQLLRQVSIRLRDVLRQSDYVSSNQSDYFISRLGGDEFSIILCKVSSQTDAEKIAARIIAVLQTPFQIGSQQVQIGGSVGIAMYPHCGDIAELLCKHADEAMYQAKSNGKNNYCHYKKY